MSQIIRNDNAVDTGKNYKSEIANDSRLEF